MALNEQGEVVPVEPIVPTSVSVEDFNSLKSSMETQMGELHKMLAQLVEAKGIESPLNPEAPPKEPSDEGVDGKTGVNLNKNESPSITPNGKGENARVPFTYSPDLPIPHPPMHMIGVPPSLNASSFTNWQASMRSHVSSANIELWKIIVSGYKTVDESNLSRREQVDC